MKEGVFISAVTSEFGEVRRQLRDALVHARYDVAIQQDFPNTPETIINVLHDEISDRHLVVHIVGHDPGQEAADAAVESFKGRHQCFLTVLRPILDALGDLNGITLTQWEAYLALHHGLPLLVYAPANRDQNFAQHEHLERLKSVGCPIHEFIDEADLINHVQSEVPAEFKTVRAFKRYVPGYLKQLVISYSSYEENRIPYLELTGTLWSGSISDERHFSSTPISIQEEIKKSASQVLLIAGDSGAGKTFAVRKSIADSAMTSLNRLNTGAAIKDVEIPIKVELGGFQSYEEVLKQVKQSLVQSGHFPEGMPLNSVEHFLNEHRGLLLCFDNLEYLESISIGILKTFIDRFTGPDIEPSKNLKFVFTSRKQFVLNRRGRLVDQLGARLLELNPLTKDQVRHCLQTCIIDASMRKRVLTNKNLLELAERPLFLYLLVENALATIERIDRAVAQAQTAGGNDGEQQRDTIENEWVEMHDNLTGVSIVDNYVKRLLARRADHTNPVEGFWADGYRFMCKLAGSGDTRNRFLTEDDWKSAAAKVGIAKDKAKETVAKLKDRGFLQGDEERVVFAHDSLREYFWIIRRIRG